MKKSSLTILIIAIALLVLLLFAIVGIIAWYGFFSYVEKVEEEPAPANVNQAVDQWQLYENARYGFGVKYPATWTLGQAPENNDGREFISPNGSITCQSYGFYNALSQTLDEYIDWLGEEPASDKQTTMAGQEARELITGYDQSVYVVGPETGYSLACHYPDQAAMDSFQDSFQIMKDSFIISAETGDASTLISQDNTWNLYTNNKYGFSMMVPKTVYDGYGAMCEWDGDSYRPKGGYVPVKVFENDSVYISTEYFYNLTGATEAGSHTNFSGCEQVMNSIANLENEDYFQQQEWEIVAKTINNDEELDAFIKERYGSGCSLGEKLPASQEGVYDIAIQGDGKDLEFTDCPLNFMTILKYNPTKHEVISWHMGQAANFYSDDYYNAYDEEMRDSFLFLP